MPKSLCGTGSPRATANNACDKISLEPGTIYSYSFTWKLLVPGCLTTRPKAYGMRRPSRWKLAEDSPELSSSTSEGDWAASLSPAREGWGSRTLAWRILKKAAAAHTMAASAPRCSSNSFGTRKAIQNSRSTQPRF